MKAVANVILIAAGTTMIVEGILKAAKPEMKIIRMSLPCGGGLAVLRIVPVLKGAAG